MNTAWKKTECCVSCRESLADNYCCLPECRCHKYSIEEVKSILTAQRAELVGKIEALDSLYGAGKYLIDGADVLALLKE